MWEEKNSAMALGNSPPEINDLNLYTLPSFFFSFLVFFFCAGHLVGHSVSSKSKMFQGCCFFFRLYV